MMTQMQVLGTKEFVSNVRYSTLYGVVDDFGKQVNKMSLMKVKDNQYVIEWEVGDDIAFEEIGIWTHGKEVVDYDGVFDLPKQAEQLLREHGFSLRRLNN